MNNGKASCLENPNAEDYLWTNCAFSIRFSPLYHSTVTGAPGLGAVISPETSSPG